MHILYFDVFLDLENTPIIAVINSEVFLLKSDLYGCTDHSVTVVTVVQAIYIHFICVATY